MRSSMRFRSTSPASCAPRPRAVRSSRHPCAGVHRQVADQLEERQRGERDVRPTFLVSGRHASPGRPLTPSRSCRRSRAADEIELQRRVELLADLAGAMNRSCPRSARARRSACAARSAGRPGCGARCAAGSSRRLARSGSCSRFAQAKRDSSASQRKSGSASSSRGGRSGKRSSTLSLRPRRLSGSRCS